MADRECRSEHGSPAGVCVISNFTDSPLHHLQNLWQPHAQFITSLSTVHIQNTEYALCPRLTHRIYTNIHDFGIYLHICVSKRLQKQHTYCQCRGAWGIVYVFFPLRTHKCPTGEMGKYILYGGKITNEDEEHRRRGYGWLHGCFLGCLRFFRSFHRHRCFQLCCDRRIHRSHRGYRRFRRRLYRLARPQP